MVQEVTDRISNIPEQIHNAAIVIGRSEHKRKVFKAIYTGKKKVKFIKEIARLTGLDPKTVASVTGTLYSNGLIRKSGRDKVLGLGYEKILLLNQRKKQILSFAGNRKKLDELPTRSQPRIKSFVSVSFSPKSFEVKRVTVNDIDSFKLVGKVKGSRTTSASLIAESKFKNGMKSIIGERGKFQDWGGEKNDLFTTRLLMKGKHLAAAFAFKGKGTNVIRLTPRHMGKNGDQIQRLFQSQADVFLIQYGKEIDESIIQQMYSFAVAISASQNRKIFYGIIDGADTTRLLHAYKKHFI